MRLAARLYASLIICLGAFAMIQAYADWSSESLLRFGVYLLLAACASALKVTLPGVRGTMSVNFFFVLIATEQLGLGETVTIGALGFIVQSVWRARSKRRLVQLLFNLATAALAASAAWHLFHWSWLEDVGVLVPLRMTAAACLYFLANTGPIATIIALTEEKSVGKVWRECYLWAFPYYLLGAALAGAFDWGSKTAGWQVAILGLPSLYFIYHSYHTYMRRLLAEKQRAEEKTQYAESISNLHLRTIEALALAIEAKDQTTHDHLQRVQVYAVEVGREMGLSELELEALRAGSLLHDIGKLAVPEQIISKPGKLTPEEFEKMKIHPIVGAEILEHVRFPYPVVPIVRSHHEKWDGTGYPDGLAGEEIPIGARILSAVDCLDALASDRPYRKALSLENALSYVVSQAGRSYDPAVVEILARRCEELERLARLTDVQHPRLSNTVKVFRGKAPAAGFEEKPTSAAPSVEFVERIGAARQEAQILFEMTRDIGSSLSLETTISVLAAGLSKLVPSQSLAVFLSQDGVAKCEFARGEDEALLSSLAIPLGQGLSGWVVQERTPLVNGNPAAEMGHFGDACKFTRLRSALSVPLEGVTGVIGALTLYSMAKEAFTRDHLRVVLAISSRLGATIENALKYRQAEDGAALDFLTQLPNARALFVHLQNMVNQCTADQSPLLVMVGDLDGFKAVNDRLGHMEGNRLLQAVATRLKQCCRESDYVARMGGDEFAIIVRGFDPHQTDEFATRFREAAIEAGRETTGFDVISLSLGVATLGTDGSQPEELLAAADRRMYQDKLRHKQVRSGIMALAAGVASRQAEAAMTLEKAT